MELRDRGFMARIPAVTKNLLIINVLFWIASHVLPRVGIDLIELLGLHIPGSNSFNPIQLVSYMFLHDKSSLMHLLFNMFALYIFGCGLEMRWGSKRFLVYYFVTGIGAGIIQELTWFWTLRDVISSPLEMVNYAGQIITKKEYLDFFVTIGASGAVFGILFAFAMTFPNMPLFIMFIPVPVKAKYVVAGYALIELVAGVISFSGDSIAHFAHLGGMLFGFLLLYYWKKTSRNGRHF